METKLGTLKAADAEKLGRKGLSCDVYRSDGQDCTANGISANNRSLICIFTPKGRDVAGPFKYQDDGHEDCLVLFEAMTGNPNMRHWRAVPKKFIDKGINHFMFGGNFVYSSDSRFPSRSPIKIFDRVER